MSFLQKAIDYGLVPPIVITNTPSTSNPKYDYTDPDKASDDKANGRIPYMRRGKDGQMKQYTRRRAATINNNGKEGLDSLPIQAVRALLTKYKIVRGNKTKKEMLDELKINKQFLADWKTFVEKVKQQQPKWLTFTKQV